MKKIILLTVLLLCLCGCNSPAEYKLLDSCERVAYNDIWENELFEFLFLDIHEIPITTLEEINATLWNNTLSESDFIRIKENNERLFEYKYSLTYSPKASYSGPNNLENILYYAISVCTANEFGDSYAMVNGINSLSGVETGNLIDSNSTSIETAVFAFAENKETLVEHLRFNVYIYRDADYQYKREFLYQIPAL